MSKLFGPVFCISILKVLYTQILRQSLHFNLFCMNHEFFSQSRRNFYKLKRGDLISRGNQFCGMSELFGPLFCISILKVLQTEIIRHSLHFSALSMIQKKFSQSLGISRSQRGGETNFRRQPILQNSELFVPPFSISILKVLWTEIVRH